MLIISALLLQDPTSILLVWQDRLIARGSDASALSKLGLINLLTIYSIQRHDRSPRICYASIEWSMHSSEVVLNYTPSSPSEHHYYLGYGLNGSFAVPGLGHSTKINPTSGKR